MGSIYEGQYIVNSFHAKDGTTGETITCDEAGYISLQEGDKVVFEDIYTGEKTSVGTLVFFAKDSDVKVQLNDNETYPFYVPAGTKRGVKNIRIYEFTALTDCELYYEGIVY